MRKFLAKQNANLVFKAELHVGVLLADNCNIGR